MRRRNNWILLVESAIILILLAVIAVLLFQTSIAREKKYHLQGNEEQNQDLQSAGGNEKNIEAEEIDTSAQESQDAEPDFVQADPESVPEETPQEPHQDGKKIVVFGDSIWDGWRDETGIASQVSALTGATIYNCAIGGSRATSDSDNTDVRGEWDSQSLNTMMYIARGELSADSQLEGLSALDAIKGIDFSTIDFVIFSYGLNDYFFNVPIESDLGMYEMNTYKGALRHAANKMREAYPNLQVIFITPTYCDIWAGEEDCTNHSFGSGVLPDYVDGMIEAAEQVNTHLINMYDSLGLNASNLKDFSDDGVHLNQEGRTKYAQIVAAYLNGNA